MPERGMQQTENRLSFVCGYCGGPITDVELNLHWSPRGKWVRVLQPGVHRPGCPHAALREDQP